MKKQLFILFQTTAIALTMSLFTSCSVGNNHQNDGPLTLNPVWILNEGNFNSSNSRITLYDPITKKTSIDFFGTANQGAPLGDSPAQMVKFNDKVYISLSNSGKAYAIDYKTGILKGKITALESPRCFAFVSNEKGYISSLYSKEVTIFNPRTNTVTGALTLGSSIEQMLIKGDYLYANQWSYGQQIVKIDIKTDKLVDSLKVGIQPNCLMEDANGNFWTLCDGGYEGNPLGYVAPKIVRVINLGDKMAIGNEFELPKGATYNYRMAIGPRRDMIYYIIANKLYSMPINSIALPTEPIATIEGAMFYSLGVSEANGDVYCGDAADYTQLGTVYRFDQNGTLLDKFSSGGVNPSHYLF